MRYYSTNSKLELTTFREAVIQGLPPDNGLFMPEYIPAIPPEFFKASRQLSFKEISLHIAQAFIEDEIPATELRRIVDDAFNFEPKLIQVQPHIYSLELFHGPTLAFKDFGARFMAQVMAYFAADSEKTLTILVATSGDTGSAVGNAFMNLPNVQVMLLYPSGGVSRIQEQQLTTLGGNIHALEVEGVFDDCQRLVKQAFLDTDLNQSWMLSSANSINIARLIPQTFYYIHAYALLNETERQIIISVPSGNFGNLTAGLFAKSMGLPVSKFVAATNINDVVPTYLASGEFVPRASLPTISNAMDVGNPSNFARMLNLYDNDLDAMRADIYGCSFTDEQTRQAMAEVFHNQGYVLDPHGAVSYLGLKSYKQQHPDITGIFLETAHPGKFHETVESVTNQHLKLPPRLAACLDRPKKATRISADFGSLKRVLMEITSNLGFSFS
ncbi:MAG: threonine synthase [Deltaproteobacteria bacterium]|nr:threonine synthase [Deltaproteobacteria bacterium]